MITDNKTQIKELIENWAKAVRSRDIDAILAHHSKDIVLFDVPEPFQSNGIDEYRKTWDLFFTYTKQGVFDIETLNVVADENVAFCIATMKCSDKSDTGDFVDLPFRLTVGLKKINDQWTIVHEHHSIPGK
ncbi:MAG TPA: nuclear transport factor 2 family protein [Puia sp.]|nr:nuclear transport factor 2 family protein [Puia sp.]